MSVVFALERVKNFFRREAKIRCENIERYLNAYCNGTLTDGCYRQMLHHFAEHQDCRKKLSDFLSENQGVKEKMLKQTSNNSQGEK